MTPGQHTTTGDTLADWSEHTLGHRFADLSLLRAALVHPSCDGHVSYQRLEFLGDRVLGLVMAEWLYQRYPNDAEGNLATRFTGLVRKETLAMLAADRGFNYFLQLAPSARDEGAGEKDSVLADITEAIIAAIYMDGGFDAAQTFIHRTWGALIETGVPATKDPKSRLQEWAQGRGLATPSYVEKDRSGPDHAPIFTVEVIVPNHGTESGSGRAKREAEQAAATAMLQRLERTS